MENELVAVVIGYVTVPLVSLVTRKAWPDEVRFCIALGLAGLAALGSIVLGGMALEADLFLEQFGLAFAAQQATWSLRVPGAGSPAINEALLEKEPI